MAHAADDPPQQQQQEQQRVFSLKGALLGMVILLLVLFLEELNEIRVEARRLLTASSLKEMPDDARSTYSSLRQHEMVVERRHEMIEAYYEENAATVRDGHENGQEDEAGGKRFNMGVAGSRNMKRGGRRRAQGDAKKARKGGHGGRRGVVAPSASADERESADKSDASPTSPTVAGNDDVDDDVSAAETKNKAPGGSSAAAAAAAPAAASSSVDESLEQRLMRLTDATSSSSPAEGNAGRSPSWSRSPIVRRQFAAFMTQCGGPEGFAAAFDRYRAVYAHAKDPSVPAGEKRVLVVRDAQARGGVGLGHQQEFYAKWLILGMTLGRAVFFQYCREKDRPWAETLPEPFNPLAPVCDEEGDGEGRENGGYDMGDYFWLMGGIDVRWRPELHRKLRAAGLTKTAVVGHCNDRVGHPAATGRAERGENVVFAEETQFFFICDCCESCGEEDFGHYLPGKYAARHKQFWTSGEEAEHPLIMFEYRTVCTRDPKLIHFRLDSRVDWYTRELPEIFKVMAEETRPAGCPSAADTNSMDTTSKETSSSSSSSTSSSSTAAISSSSSSSCLTGEALPRGWNDPVASSSGVGGPRFGAEWTGPEEDTFTNEDTRWGRCALHALLQPSPAVQHAAAPVLAQLAEQGDHRPLVGLHIRTLAVDVLRCIPLDTPKTWEGVDYAFLHKDPTGEPAESCRQTPYVCRDAPLFWPEAFGSLSGYFRCAKRIAGLGLPFASAREGMDNSSDARLFVTTDSSILHAFFAEQAEAEEGVASGATMYGGPDGAAAMVPTWNNFGGFGSVDKLLGRGGTETSLRDKTREKRASWLKAAVDFYILSAADVIVSPVWSSFGDGAARRAFPFTPVVGQMRHVCELLHHYKGDASAASFGKKYQGLEQCFFGLPDGLDVRGNPSDAQKALNTLAQMAAFRSRLDYYHDDMRVPAPAKSRSARGDREEGAKIR